MSTRKAFSYQERLPQRTLDRLPEILKVNERSPEILIIIRMLSGSIKIEHKKSSKKINQEENYFSANFRNYGQTWDKKFPPLVGEDFTLGDLAKYIEENKLKNRKFYSNILSELSYYFYYQSKKIHSSAFIFLYRTLEHISYAFPLIYASKTDNFEKTFNSLKNLMNNDKNIGELGFLKNFVKTVYLEDPIYSSSLDFIIDHETDEEKSKTFNILKSLCTDAMIASSTSEPRSLSINYPEVGSFIITIRNRFFHYMNGGAKNIETTDIRDIDELFSIINKKSLYWISTIFLTVFSYSIIKSER
ncbi:hypothetical protein [Alcaligenes endophyticus]|uniref:Uncharacterized protein n=1 Tax=Alcaligenes endophyticus TaxID=1929088 RepID=A0ABT8EKD2_9BURK|nr:hypothetical protein [Alcaligenes endophyticus]MCX5590897.1 hypothetical protein [Alcaligenes endophyticus]MDN4121741.1 hypothetical protein [Alcaligenes endophyticus]